LRIIIRWNLEKTYRKSVCNNSREVLISKLEEKAFE
jgi:hypothetical protein